MQNFYLWYAYSVCKQRILNKNGSAELGEKRLYHGTSAKSCDCIEKGRFDRSYAGAHGKECSKLYCTKYCEKFYIKDILFTIVYIIHHQLLN